MGCVARPPAGRRSQRPGRPVPCRLRPAPAGRRPAHPSQTAGRDRRAPVPRPGRTAASRSAAVRPDRHPRPPGPHRPSPTVPVPPPASDPAGLTPREREIITPRPGRPRRCPVPHQRPGHGHCHGLVPQRHLQGSHPAGQGDQPQLLPRPATGLTATRARAAAPATTTPCRPGYVGPATQATAPGPPRTACPARVRPGERRNPRPRRIGRDLNEPGTRRYMPLADFV